MTSTSVMMMEHNTKFGIVKLNESTGYYKVQQAFLHHLVWIDHYNKPIPKSCVIHHVNGDKTDNRIQNLMCVPKKTHDSFHSSRRSDETKQKIGEKFFKPYARIVKNGYTNNGKAKYGIKVDKKIIKQSTNPLNLIKWFKLNYPNDILQIKGAC